MSFKPIESEVRKALGIIAGTVTELDDDEGNPSPVDDYDKREAIEYITLVLKHGWNS